MSNTEVFKKAGPLVRLTHNNGSAKGTGEKGPYAVTTSYFNYTGNNITVVTRNDIRFTVKPILDMNMSGFIIREHCTLDGNAALEMIAVFKRTPEENLTPDMKAIKPVFLQHSALTYLNPVSFVIETVITDEAFKEAHGNVYAINKDIMVSKDNIDVAPAHPYSVKELLSPAFKEKSKEINGINFSIEIVDNDNSIANRIYHLANKLFDIVPVKDSSRQTGVYLSFSNVGLDGKRTMFGSRYTLEEAEEVLGLYKTREEAVAHGDIEGKRKSELARLTHEIAVIQDKNKKELIELETRNKEAEYLYKNNELANKQSLLELEGVLAKVKLEAEQNKIIAEQHKNKLAELNAERSAYRQDYYESRSYERKDSSEFFKFIPTAIAAAVAIGGWFMLS